MLVSHAIYSNRRQPNRRMFSKIHQRLRETGQFKSHLVDHLLEFLHSRKIFYAQLKKILEHLVEESPCKKDQAITLCGTFWSIFAFLSCHIQTLLPVDLQSLFVNSFFIDAIKIHNFCAIFCLLMRHPSPGMGSITFTTYTFGEMKILILS